MKVAAFLLLASCGGISGVDQMAVRQNAALNLAAMDRADGGERALNRAAWCADVGIAKRNAFALPDGGPSCDGP